MTGHQRVSSSWVPTWQRIGMELATHRVGRIVMHMAAAAQDRQLRWHLAGIARELGRPSVVG